MGVDLILLPIDHESDDAFWGFSHTVLSLERATELWERIRVLADGPVPPSFTTFVCREAEDEEMHYGNTQHDAYGALLCSVTVADLLPLAQHPGVTEAARNRAAWAYLGALPPHTRVALYWH